MLCWCWVGVGTTVLYAVLVSAFAVDSNAETVDNRGIPAENQNTIKIDADSLKSKPEDGTVLDNSWASLRELADHQEQMDHVDRRRERVDTLSPHHLRKREAKKPKNTKKRKKLNKKKTGPENEESESESKHKPPSKSASETEESETAPETSDETTSSSSVSSSSISSSSSYEDLSSGDLHSHSDEDSEQTEEVSLTSEEEDSDELESSGETYSGPDSSPPASSDSTDESSASRAISGSSSEVSYTMSSSAEDAFPVSNEKSREEKLGVSYSLSSDASVYSSSEDTSEEESESKSKSDKDKSKKKREKSKSKSAEKSKETRKSGENPKITTKIRKKKNKKITEINIKLNKMKKADRDKNVLLKGENNIGMKGTTNVVNEKQVKAKVLKEHESIGKINLRENKIEVRGKELKRKDETKYSESVQVKGKHEGKNAVKIKAKKGIKGKEMEKQIGEGLRIKSSVAASVPSGSGHRPTTTAVKLERVGEEGVKKPGMEMMKVKKAEVDPKKKTELEQELIKDYPVSGTVEITNWQGTFAPIAGEPYVAPLHHQPDSFWDAIYRSTDPDLPTPPGVVSLPEGGTDPFAPTKPPISISPEAQHLAQDEILMKNKDKGKKQEKKKPKLSPKEKKKKKKEKQQEKEGSKKVAGAADKSEPHIQSLARPNILHAATKSGEILKTPSEEERESGTTYKPEGAYEYPSFRHPDFNPDTAYDENGIPIHESPGWTPPPTLPGDHRFGKERSRAGAGLRDRAYGPIVKPSLALNHKTDLHQLHNPSHTNTVTHQNFHKSQGLIAAREHQHMLESVDVLLLGQPASSVKDHHQVPIHLTDNQRPNELHGVPLVLPALHHGIVIKNEIVNHKIQKRKADTYTSAEAEEGSSGGISTNELTATADKYKKKVASMEFGVYRLSDQEKKNTEANAAKEALNPALFMYRNMVQVKKNPHSENNPLEEIPEGAELIAVIVSPQDAESGIPAAVQELDIRKLRKKHKQKSEKPVVYNKDNEAVNPLLYKHRNMFKVSDIKDDGLKLNQELIKQMALHQLQTKQQEVKKAVPIDEYLKGPQMLRGRGRENYNPVFINPKKMLHVKTNKFELQSEEHFVAKREAKVYKNPFLIPLHNPNNLRRKTRDDDDSFASYFDGVDPNVVEEEESTTRPEVTTMALIEIDPAEFLPRKYNRTYPRGVRHTPSTLPPEPKHYTWNKEFLSTEHLPFYVGHQVPDPTIKRPHLLQDSSVFCVDQDPTSTESHHGRANNRKQRKLAHRKKKLVETNAAILHRLTRELRGEFLDHNIHPDNTTVEFTESLQREIAEAVELKLLEGTPDENTLDQLTHQVYESILVRQQQNRSVGHIVTGVRQREPLMRGTVHISPDRTQGEYHLRYWPLNEISGGPRVLNGSLDLNDLRIDLNHKNAANKILRRILTVRPRELTHHEADIVLNRIFTKPTDKLSTIKPTMRITREPATARKLAEKNIRTKSMFEDQKIYVDLPQNVVDDLTESGIENVETLKPMKQETDKLFRQEISRPVSSDVSFTPGGILSSTGKETEADCVKSVLEAVTEDPTTEFPMAEEFNKLRETITKSKNISSILWEEMVAREKIAATTFEEVGKKPEDRVSSFGNWKLQQRIKVFRPGRGYPTMPPFVRRWPTFRSQCKVDLIPAAGGDFVTPVISRGAHLSTFLTMRPKYGGPRHEPFFFNDFSRIKTVYPTGVTTETSETRVETTKAVMEESKRSSSITSSAMEEPRSKTTLKHFPWPRFDWEKLDEKRRKFYKIGYEFRNETPYDSFESSTTFEIPSYDWDNVVEKQSDHHRVGGKYRHLYTKQRTTTWNYYEDDDSIFRGFDHNTTGRPYFVELKVSDKVHTVRPFYVRPTPPPPPTVPPATPTTPPRSGLHKIKHHVSTGLKKLFSIFRFGRSKKED